MLGQVGPVPSQGPHPYKDLSRLRTPISQPWTCEELSEA